MQFESLAAALTMGGHGPYVWTVVLVSVVVAAWLLLSPWRRARRQLKLVSRLVSEDSPGDGNAPGP